MDFQEVGRTLLAQQFVFAKTMPHVPHWYTLRKHWASDDAFVEVVEYIREHGYDDPYGGRNYKALNVNEDKYWTMGAPLKDTILINRKPHGHVCAYDAVADSYDNLFSDPDSLRENTEIIQSITFPVNGSVLDIGCGSGLLLDYRHIDNYLGIDPSRKMLENGWTDAEICNELGMEPEEVLRLKHITGFSKLFADREYNKTWVNRRQILLKQRYEESVKGDNPQITHDPAQAADADGSDDGSGDLSV